MAKCEHIKSVTNIRRIHLKILSVDLVLSGKVMGVISVYGFQGGRNEKDKDGFYDDSSDEMQAKDQNRILLGDFNRHVGSLTNGYKGVHEGKNKKSKKRIKKDFWSSQKALIWWLVTPSSKNI